MESTENESEAAAAIAAMETYAGFESVDITETDDDGTVVYIGHYAVVPAGKSLTSVKKFIDEYRTEPERREGLAALTTLDSFIDHTKRFADDDSAVFADVVSRTSAQLVSVLDY